MKEDVVAYIALTVPVCLKYVRKRGCWFKVNSLVIPKRGRKKLAGFEPDFRSLKETNLWPRKMGREVG